MISNKKKKTVISVHKIHENDTGSTPVQIALLTETIKTLTEHLKVHKKDLSSRMGLIKMVSQRRKLLNYFKKINEAEYAGLLTSLGIRK